MPMMRFRLHSKILNVITLAISAISKCIKIYKIQAKYLSKYFSYKLKFSRVFLAYSTNQRCSKYL